MASSNAVTGEGMENQEDANDLKFNKEFDNAQALMISEVKLLLEERKKLQETFNEDQELPEVFQKTYDYVQQFSKFTNEQTVKTVRQTLSTKSLHPFEMVAIGNLCPEVADEAKSYIRSLESNIDDEELQEMLDEIKTHISYQY
ncbi:DNA-directed RNA polymerase II subunit RPB4-like [Oopsacas minuta]|uniref:DNA-directed RNA polymerase II subunit RPB4-like n=1 Tax=Oopsacas minuta TaxID=111878 RepID=A0AAV7K0X2_9METZ|nr:DNA-directed RNA polymerase II subunit RPB4-like [Oopsacas minuta]